MILIGTQQIIQGDKVEAIKSYQVVFNTPFGWSNNLEQAIKTCEDNGLAPNTCVFPTVMVIGETLQEVLR